MGKSYKSSIKKCTICGVSYPFAVVNDKKEVINHLCGSCIKNVYGKLKKNEQTKLLL